MTALRRNIAALRQFVRIWWLWLTIGRKVRREYRRCQHSGEKFFVDDYLSGD